MNELKWAWTSVCGLYRLVAHLSGFSTAIAPNPLWKTPPHVGYNANKSSLQAQAKALKKNCCNQGLCYIPRSVPLCVANSAPFMVNGPFLALRIVGGWR